MKPLNPRTHRYNIWNTSILIGTNGHQHSVDNPCLNLLIRTHRYLTIGRRNISPSTFGKYRRHLFKPFTDVDIRIASLLSNHTSLPTLIIGMRRCHQLKNHVTYSRFPHSRISAVGRFGHKGDVAWRISRTGDKSLEQHPHSSPVGNVILTHR